MTLSQFDDKKEKWKECFWNFVWWLSALHTCGYSVLVHLFVFNRKKQLIGICLFPSLSYFSYSPFFGFWSPTFFHFPFSKILFLILISFSLLPVLSFYKKFSFFWVHFFFFFVIVVSYLVFFPGGSLNLY